MFVVLFGTFMVVLDTTVVNLGLPSLQREFEVDAGVEWVVTAYLAAVGVAHTCSGWLADRFGRKSMFILSMALFTAASLLCAVSVTFEMLVGSRVLQGLAGGLLTPIAMAMIYELFEPSERGRALGYFGIAIMVAPAIGPVLSGGLVSSLSWRWLFLINLPIGIIGVPIAIRLLRDTGFHETRPFDRAGLALSGTGLILFLIGMSQGGIWGWASPVTLALLLSGAAFLAIFVHHVGRTDHPLVDLSLLSNRTFAIAMVTIALSAVAQFTRLVYIPLELNTLRGVSEVRIGLVMLPSALGMAATMPIGGRLVDRVGARIPVTIGATILGLSFIGLAMVTLTTSLLVISGLLFVGGLGAGLSMMAPNIIAMNSIEARHVSQASGLSNVTRQIAAAVGVAILASIFASTTPESMTTSDALHPYTTVYLIAAGLLAASLVTAQFLPGKLQALALQAERAAESPPDQPAHPPTPHEVF